MDATPIDARATFLYARVRSRAWPEREPRRRPSPPDAWTGPWSPEHAPPQEVHRALLAGDAGRWAELRARLADNPTGPWCRQVWYSAGPTKGPELRALLTSLPPEGARRMFDEVPSWGAPDGLGDLFADPTRCSDEAMARYFVGHLDEEVPWDRVAAVARQPRWSAAWASAVTLLERAPDGLAALEALRAVATDPAQQRWLDRAGLPVDRPEEQGPAIPTLLACLHSPADSSDERLSAARQLLRLAGADAVSVLASLGDDPAIGAALAPLRSHPNAGDVERALVACGVTCIGCDDALLLPLDVLQRGAAVLTFDPKTSTFPVGHDGLLRRLARLVPALGELVFEEIPHTFEDGPRGSPEQLDDAYVLRAWSGPIVWEVVAGDTSSRSDVIAVVGLLNTVCRDQGLDDRFVMLPTYDAGVMVLAAPEGAIRCAARAGLLPGVAAEPTDEERLAEALARHPGRELSVEVDPEAGVRDVVWWRTVVEVVTDPERELALLDARATAPGTDWLPGDTCGVPSES